MNTIYAYWWNPEIKDRKYGYMNFGDVTVKNVIESISNIPVAFEQKQKDKRLVSTGSLLCNKNKLYYTDIIWGTGSMYGLDHVPQCNYFDVRLCRGPWTASVLRHNGIECPELYCDPGVLIPFAYDIKPKKKVYDIGIVLHFRDIANNTQNILNYDFKCSYVIIDPTEDVNKILSTISQCKMILSSSLHGIIVSEVMNIPSLWIELSSNNLGNGFKFKDYYTGSGREVNDIEKIDWKHGINDKDLYKEHKFVKANHDYVSLLNTFPFQKKENIVNEVKDYFEMWRK